MGSYAPEVAPYDEKQASYSPDEKEPAWNVGKGFQEDIPVDERDMERDMVERKGSSVGEAAVLYGDVATAEHYGNVQRGLKSRHIQFIALGGTIGTGLFLGIGTALADYGPLSILLGYTITGIMIFFMMNSLGEMATWIPLPGAIPQYAARFVDPAMGFAVGWNQWYSYALSQCSELTAAATLISYWNDEINPAAWIAIFIVVILALNIFAVQIYGEAEFIFASIKIITILGLLLFAFIVDLGGSPTHDRIGFRYWNHPGAMTATVASGNAGRFLSFFSTLVNASFSYGGVEGVAVAAGEAANPRVNIPKAVRRVFWRILFFYSLGSLAVGVLVPYDDMNLTGDGTAASPWVIAIQRAKISGLPSVINAVILTSATSAGNAFLYLGSRYLFALAQNGHAPRIFLKCSKRGLPYVCVLFTGMFTLLSFMAAGSGSYTVFGWFLNLTTISNIFTWCSILVSSLHFRYALKAQGVKSSDLPFKGVFMPYGTYISLIFFSLILFFNGWQVFTTGNWSFSDFFTAYIGMPIYFALYVFWKIFKRTKAVKPSEADLWTGKAAIDAQVWPERVPANIWEKIWFWIA